MTTSFWRIHALALLVVMATTLMGAAPVKDAGSDGSFKILVRQVLDAYSEKNVQAIVAMLDDRNPVVMGADVAEVATSKEAIAKLLKDDFRLWDSSRFGDFQNFFLQSSGDMATVLCDVPWSARSHGSTKTYVIRLATVWRKVDGAWKLSQVLDAVPTAGQSAQEILRSPHRQHT